MKDHSTIRIYRLPTLLLPKEMKKVYGDIMVTSALEPLQHLILDFGTVRSITTEALIELQYLLKVLQLLGKKVYFAAIPSSLAPALVPFLSNYPFDMFYRSIPEALSSLSFNADFQNVQALDFL